MESTSFTEAKQVRAARVACDNGFSAYGYIQDDSILVKVSGFWRTKKGFFGGERKYLDTGELGEIFINDEARGAEKSNWVMHVYGRSILPEMQNLAKRLAEEFAVHVHVRLETEERKWDCGEYPGT